MTSTARPWRAAAVILALPLLAATGGAQQARAATGDVRLAAASAPAAYAVADTAIDQLEEFLQRYPDSPLRPNALFQLGELLVRRAEENFAAQQRASSGNAADSSAPATGARGADTPIRPEFGPAIARYEELVRRYPNFEKIDAAAYTLGTLYTGTQRWADAARVFQMVVNVDSSRFRPEALFRLGDAHFELAARERGDARRAEFARAADAYEKATASAPKSGDIYFLSLYKLGWAYYNQATQTNTQAYDKAVQTFGELVSAYDKLSPEQQARLGLRQEAIEYMAVAFTQVGGAEAANQYFSQPGRGQYKQVVLQRVAQSLRDQGDFTRAVQAYEALMQESPNDSSALAAQNEIIDIYQNRMLEPERAQTARLALVERFAPGTPWAQANPGQVAEASKAREQALRQSGQFLLARAQQKNDKASFQQAAALYERYSQEFANADSAQAVQTYYAEALFGQGEYMKAGAAYSRAAYGFSGQPAAAPTDTTTPRDTTARAGGTAASRTSMAERAGQNAIVAYDSALARNKTDRGAQDSLFAAVDRFVQAFPQSDVAKKALIAKGRRASETQRWDEMAQAFRTYATTYPNDPYTPTAQKLVGDALYRGGSYAEAQVQWEQAQQVAQSSGRRALADSIAATRATATSLFADTLIKKGEYRRAAEEVYVAYADKNPQGAKAPDALRDAVETYMIVIDSAKSRNIPDDQVQQARNRAIELSARLVQQYPNYKYRLQYQNLNARLLAESGRREEAVEALRGLATNTQNPQRAAAQARLAVTLDSLGRDKEAAAEYERFATQYPTNKDAANSLFNAAVTYREAGDTANAVRVYGQFAAKYPRDERAATARGVRYDLLMAQGDTSAARTELARVCANPTAEQAASCRAERARLAAGSARAAFDQAQALYNQYADIKLVIRTRAALTPKGVAAASAQKQAMLRRLNAQLQSVIKLGNAEYVAAATYTLGLAQWEYGDFLRGAQLPEDLNDEERAAGQRGAAQQAVQYYNTAKQVWQALINKADQDDTLKNDEGAKQWLDKAREAANRDVPGASSSNGGMQ